ncbi:kinase-like domain-containing protein [Crucibulum laeve]|uniref:non-specific serine/threonine protein kinase n=1 Tax=Crucibulum laeve TaxID=68775 RepID=A0A5C3M0Z4_9AGAR|nr:kinase-like domain-containing protein [Crucibulum laeve]
MSSKTPAAASSPIHPPIGTLIDGDSLELVEVLGVGGYGVVYRAVDTRPLAGPKSYAVKCLVSSGHQTQRQRQIHIREIALHQIASAHPGVVTLHRVVESYNHTYIIMDYAPDHDLFTQILHSCRYLGDDSLIKHVFLQLLDAVEYCHSLGIYHRDLKPENVLCFDDGLRIAITDFGLATTDKVSDEFRTGSVYHMSPECQGGEFAPKGTYSPMSNDIWSLGIILLNLATGRNPWKSATLDDPTFQAYLRDPVGFLPTVLPISPEVNDILVRMLDVDFRERMTLREVRHAIEDVESFYSEGVIFEGSMARCPWESGMDIDSDSSDTVDDAPSPPKSPSPQLEDTDYVSRWSKDTSSDIVFAQSLEQESSYGNPWTNYSSCAATWAFESNSSTESDRHPDMMDMFNRSRSSSSSIQSPISSLPVTPDSLDQTFGARAIPTRRAALKLNTNLANPRFHEAHASVASFSTGSSMMQTAIDYDPYSSSFFQGSQASSESKSILVMPQSAITVVTEDKEMRSPTAWPSSATEMSSPSRYSHSSAESSAENCDVFFSRSATPSPEPHWSEYRTEVQSTPPFQSQLSPPVSTTMTDVTSSSRPSIFTSRKSHDGKSKANGYFTIKFFPRSPPSAPTPPPPSAPLSHGRFTFEFDSTYARNETPPPTFVETAYWGGVSSPLAAPTPLPPTQGRNGRHTPYLRSPRHWFIPGRFFASAGAA